MFFKPGLAMLVTVGALLALGGIALRHDPRRERRDSRLLPEERRRSPSDRRHRDELRQDGDVAELWNVAGATGPAGPRGAQGPQGPAGVNGAKVQGAEVALKTRVGDETFVDAETLSNGSNAIEVDCQLTDNSAVGSGHLSLVKMDALN
jgi:hypothetical protein